MNSLTLSRRKVLPLVYAVLFGVTGTLLLLHSHAATPTTSIESEDGSLNGNAIILNDGSASGGSAVEFGHIQVANAGPPYYFGSLVTPTSEATAEAPTMKLAMVEMSWNNAQPNAPTSTNSGFNDTYLQTIESQITAFHNAGRQVVLGFGYHYTPQWVKNLSQMVDQAGTANTSQANMVFSQAVRDAMNNYIQHVNTIIPLKDIWAVRVNVTSSAGEIQYPDSNYWAFSTGAQNGADKPNKLAPNPFPGWKPDTGDTSLTTTQVNQWAMWYQGAIANLLDEQMSTVASTGFRGYYMLVSAGSGERPSSWTSDVNNKLQSTSLIGRGVAWDKLYSQLSRKRNVVAYSSSAAEASNYNACTDSDDTVPITSTTANSWSSGRWLSRVADEYGFLKAGENPGYSDSSASYYSDTSTSGMMAHAMQLTQSCRWLAFFWAHDAQLWPSGSSAAVIPYSTYASYINQVNNNNNPEPDFPN